MLEKVTLPISLRNLSLYLPPKISQKYSGHRYGKARSARYRNHTEGKFG